MSAYSSPTELESLGLDRLKAALMALGLKCGGSVVNISLVIHACAASAEIIKDFKRES